MFLDEDGVLFRWESEDLTISKAASSLNPTDMRDFITPTVTFLKSRRQMIFGVRFGFLSNPKQWQFSERLKSILKAQHLVVRMSNSSSTSGKVVTAGYILFKAPNTTHRHRYTQFLRSQLPEATPYFDLIRNKKTPMDQLIPHLVIQCGEKHVTPLCQVLSTLLTGHGTALFIPRYAFSVMTEDQVNQHFLFHERWAKSLKPIPLKPHITHLDQLRTEYYDDGKTIERSTRTWAATLRLADGTPALSDVTNGSNERHATLLVPAHFFETANTAWRQYRSRLHPPGHREARFRDGVTDLPDHVHIQKEVDSHMTFLAKLSSADVWKSAPPSIRGTGNDQTPPAAAGILWPTLPPSSKNPKKPVSTSERYGTSTWNMSGQTSLASEDSRSIDSTQNLTASSKDSQNRFKQLEDLIRTQQKQSHLESQVSKTRLTNMELQFNRIDDLDTKVAAIQSDLSTVHGQLSAAAQNQHQMSLDLQALQSNTSSQFEVLGQNGIAAMESQHSLSTSLLDLRSQFSQMSRLMQDMSNKLELNLTSKVASENTRKPPKTGEQNRQTNAAAKSNTLRDDAKLSEIEEIDEIDDMEASVCSSRHSGFSDSYSHTSSHGSRQDTATESSSIGGGSLMEDDLSVTDQSHCPSPTKKKPRSTPGTEETLDDLDECDSVEEASQRRITRRHTMVSTNLGTRFESVIEPAVSPSRLRNPASSPATSTVSMTDTPHHTQKAPLDPQYNETGPDGANNT